MKSEIILSVTSLLESEAGVEPSNSQIGQPIELFGPEVAPVSRTARPAKARGIKTQEISGLNSSASSASANLTLCLANRLQVQLTRVGSMEYNQIWKKKITPAGQPYWAHTASVLRTSDKDSTGWQTVSVEDASMEVSEQSRMEYVKHNRTCQCRLRNEVHVTGWPTPDTQSGNTRPNKKGGIKVMDVAPPGWATPQASDNVEGSRTKLTSRQKCLGRDLREIIGPNSTLLIAKTAKSEESPSLNPFFIGWMMGFTQSWTLAGLGLSFLPVMDSQLQPDLKVEQPLLKDTETP